MRHALLTGAASGLCAGVAVALARDGFERITITHRTTSPDATLAAVSKAGAHASAARIDFEQPEDALRDALEELVREHGPFDTVVHGVGPIVVKRFERCSLDDYRAMFDGNVRSAIMLAQAILPAMRVASFGRIVLFGMTGSSVTQPFRGFTLHGAAKSAVTAFARSLALEEARHNITVNVIEPGDIRDKSMTRQEALHRESRTPRGRPGTFEDVADVVRFLVARERDFLTGAVISVNGGLTVADERNADPS